MHCCAGVLLWSRHLVLVASSLLTAGWLLLQAGCCLLAIALERGLLCRSAVVVASLRFSGWAAVLLCRSALVVASLSFSGWAAVLLLLLFCCCCLFVFFFLTGV